MHTGYLYTAVSKGGVKFLVVSAKRTDRRTQHEREKGTHWCKVGVVWTATSAHNKETETTTTMNNEQSRHQTTCYTKEKSGRHHTDTNTQRYYLIDIYMSSSPGTL